MPVTVPNWFKTLTAQPLPVGSVLPCAFVDTDDPWVTVVAVIPEGGRWTIDVGVDENFNGVVDPIEWGTTSSFIQEGNLIRLTLSDMRFRPPASPRYFRARRVS